MSIRDNRPIRLDGRGFRPTGNGRKGRCPHCGKAISHGLPGNPYNREFQPCQKKELEEAKRNATPQDQPTQNLPEDSYQANLLGLIGGVGA